MSYYTLWRSPELLGGIVALSGRLLDEINTSDRDIDIYQDRRVFIGHGVHDQVIPVSASDPTSTFVRSLGIEPALHFYDIGHTISEDEISDIIVWLG